MRRAELPLLALIAFCAAIINAGDWHELKWVNIAISLLIMGVLGRRIMVLVRHDSAYLFTPAVWFRAATLVYFGFGNIVPYLLGPEGDTRFRVAFDFTDRELFKFNLIVLVSVVSVLVANAAVARPFRLLFETMPTLRAPRVRLGLWQTCLIFLTLGAAFRYGVLLPRMFGLSDTVLPGVLGRLGLLFYAGLFLLVLHALRNRGRSVPLAVALIAFEVSVSFASFAKIELMMTGIMVWLALLWDRVTIRRLLIGASLLAVAYYGVVPLVDFGRMQMRNDFGGLGGAEFDTRKEYVNNYLRGEAPLIYKDVGRGDRTMSRLSYVNVSTFIIDAYDKGRPGETYKAALTVLIPRILWPDKPIISNQGVELTELIFGQRGSSTGSGIYSEAYWNFGWAGVVLGMGFYGILVAFLTQLALVVMRRELWLFLPVALAGVQFGTRVDGRMSTDVVGSFGITLVLFVLLIGIRIVAARRSRRGAAAPALRTSRNDPCLARTASFPPLRAGGREH